MSIGNLTANVFGLSQEAQLSLASARFDFTLFKVEAPIEFQKLGTELTRTRKQAAEDGSPHTTARRLGALFQHALPSTPALIKAYGIRASEIATCRDVNPKRSPAYGVFREHAGIDGTSIWAAATSGPEAICTHLLACILARIWSPSEAISIWVELVDARKKELEKVDEAEPLYFESLSTSRIVVSREQLAEWDASARAWLRAADTAMGFKQKQLMLILANVSLPVNRMPVVYQSVLETWTAALAAVDQLVQGIPLSIQSGSALIGLAAWHIYPDMLVLGKYRKEVLQNDSLVKHGGLLTIGLNLKSPTQQGIYWSLPLSQMRYYGKPVVSERSLDTQGNRINVGQLFIVALGSMTASWAMESSRIALWLERTWDQLSELAANVCRPGTPHWLGILAQSSSILVSEDCLEKRIANQLFKFGGKRAPNFVVNKQGGQTPLFFGLSEFANFYPILNREGKIQCLREAAKDMANDLHGCFFIRYLAAEANVWELATAVPVSRDSSKRKLDSSQLQDRPEGHCRFLTDMNTARRLEIEAMGEDTASVQKLGVFSAYDGTEFSLTSATDLGIDPSARFTFLLGDEKDISLFWASDYRTLDPFSSYRPNCSLKIDDTMFNAFWDKALIDKTSTLVYLDNFVRRWSELHASLKAIATISAVYKLLPGATIAMEVTSQPLYLMPWTRNASSEKPCQFSTFPMNWRKTFSCITLLESGSLAVQPAAFDNAMAVVIGDAIYVAAILLCDPSESPGPLEIRRIIGNIGTPGIAVLTPPADPQLAEFDPSSWRQVNHHPYDGKIEDSFQGTSMHLSFTGYKLPLELGNQGYKDVEIYFMETRVTVHDNGAEIGDVDILGHLQSNKLRRIPACSHLSTNEQLLSNALIDNPKLTMLDTWAELLDEPETTAIARSHENWLGRLALTVVSLQMGFETIVTPNKFCWKCIQIVKKIAVQSHASDTENELDNNETTLSNVEAVQESPIALYEHESVYTSTAAEMLDDCNGSEPDLDDYNQCIEDPFISTHHTDSTQHRLDEYQALHNIQENLQALEESAASPEDYLDILKKNRTIIIC